MTIFTLFKLYCIGPKRMILSAVKHSLTFKTCFQRMHCEYNTNMFCRFILSKTFLNVWFYSDLHSDRQCEVTQEAISCDRITQSWCALPGRKLHLGSVWHISQGTLTTCGLRWPKQHCLLWLWLVQSPQRLMVYLVCWEEAFLRDWLGESPNSTSFPFHTIVWPKQKQTDGTVKPNTSDNTSVVHMSYRGYLILSYAVKNGFEKCNFNGEKM